MVRRISSILASIKLAGQSADALGFFVLARCGTPWELRAIMWRYHNPVEIGFGVGALARLPALLAGWSYALVT